MLSVSSLTAALEDKFDAALRLYTQDRPEEALRRLDELIADNGTDSALFHARANVYFEMRKYDDALRDYGAAISRNPDDASAFGDRGWVYKRIGNLKAAEQDWKRAAEILGANDVSH